MFQTQIYKSWVEMQANGGSSEVGLIGTYKVYLKDNNNVTLGTPGTFTVSSVLQNGKIFTTISDVNVINFVGANTARKFLITKDMPLADTEVNVCVYDFGRDIPAGNGFRLDLTDVIFYMITVRDQG